MKSLLVGLSVCFALFEAETVGYCFSWQRHRIGFCRPHSSSSQSVLLRDTDKDATSPFIREESSDSSSAWPLLSISRNGSTNDDFLKRFPTSQLGNQSLVPLECKSASKPSFSTFSKANGHDSSSQMPSLSSWERALEQVHALVDLCANNTSHQDSISDDILLTAVNSLIHRQRSGQLVLSTNTLGRLEELVWRLQHMNGLPIRSLIEETWNLQQVELQRCSRTQQFTRRYCYSLVERKSRLLLCWMQWSQQEQQLQADISIFRSSLQQPPPEYIMSTFQLAVRSNVSVTPSLWNLYNLLQDGTTSSNDFDGKIEFLPREYYSSILRLSLAAPSHIFSPFQVLQDMDRQYQKTRRSFYKPTIPELQEALEAASRHGNATEAAWLFQQLLVSYDVDLEESSIESTENSDDGIASIYDEKVGHWRWLLLQAISHSPYAATSPAAVALYAHRLVTSWQEKPQSFGRATILPHRDHYHQLLQMWAVSRATGAGRSAEAIYIEMMNQNASTPQPNFESFNREDSLLVCFQRRQSRENSVHQVVLVYLQEMPSSLQNIREADRFARNEILTRQPSYQRFQTSQPEETTLEKTTSLPTIEAILAAYAALAPSEPKVAMHAEQLFRFLLVQHRDGRTSEEPNPTHLKYVMSLVKDSDHGDNVCVEMFQLVSSLADSKVLSKGPDGDNIMQLLKIMSDSGKSGYSIFAKQIFQLLSQQSVPDEQMQVAANHVARCLQQEKATPTS